MTRLRWTLAVLLSVLVLSPFALSRQGQTKPAKSQASEGETRFRTNCGRCHNAPEAISRREVRAVVRQMRVRAMLSAEDEKLILGYLAP